MIARTLDAQMTNGRLAQSDQLKFANKSMMLHATNHNITTNNMLLDSTCVPRMHLFVGWLHMHLTLVACHAHAFI